MRWITEDGKLCTLRRLDGVPEDQAALLRLKILERLKLIDTRRNADELPRFNTDVVILIQKTEVNPEARSPIRTPLTASTVIVASKSAQQELIFGRASKWSVSGAPTV